MGMMMKFWKAAIWSNLSAHRPAIRPRAPIIPAPSSANTRIQPGLRGLTAVRRPHRHQQHPAAHHHAAHHRGAHIGHEPGPVRQRRHQQEHQVAGDLALDQRGAGVGKGVLQHAHHHQARDQEAGVAHVVVDLHMVFEHVAENQQVKHRSEHRRAHSLEGDLPETQHLLVKQACARTGQGVEVLSASASRWRAAGSGVMTAHSWVGAAQRRVRCA